MPHDLDRIDRKLLRLFQENTHLPAEKIGAAIGLSPFAAGTLKRGATVPLDG
jgi:Lrp/AsnC family leucine-responsive transcriptional regulator